MLRVGDKGKIEGARVLRIMKDADVSSSRITRSFVRDHSARIIILLEKNRVGRRDDEPQATSFRQAPRHEQSGRKIAF